MGVPWMRAVLRATFDARRSARPTAAVSILVSLLTLGFFMVLAPILVACRENYHTPSMYRLKDYKCSENFSSCGQNAESHRCVERYGLLVSREWRRGEGRAVQRGDAGK